MMIEEILSGKHSKRGSHQEHKKNYTLQKSHFNIEGKHSGKKSVP